MTASLEGDSADDHTKVAKSVLPRRVYRGTLLGRFAEGEIRRRETNDSPYVLGLDSNRMSERSL